MNVSGTMACRSLMPLKQDKAFVGNELAGQDTRLATGRCPNGPCLTRALHEFARVWRREQGSRWISRPGGNTCGTAEGKKSAVDSRIEPGTVNPVNRPG